MSILLTLLLKSTRLTQVQLRAVSTSPFLLKERVDLSKVPVLKEDDLEEAFIKGHGPGGQNVNKRSNCVQLRHIPSGLVVKAHQSRLLDTNRKIAREILTDKLDQLMNGDESVASQKKRLEEKKSSKSDAKRRKLQELKAAWKEREDGNSEKSVGVSLESRKKLLEIVEVFKTVKREKSTYDYSKVPTLNEDDLEEQIIRGSGTHKVTNCISLIHKPTGIVVKGTKSRILSENRKIARELLIEKLDEKFNREDSILAQKRKIEMKKSSSRESKRKKLNELKLAWKETDNISKEN